MFDSLALLTKEKRIIQLIVGGDTLRKLETKSDCLKPQVVGNLEKEGELHKKPKVKETNYTPEKATWLPSILKTLAD